MIEVYIIEIRHNTVECLISFIITGAFQSILGLSLHRLCVYFFNYCFF